MVNYTTLWYSQGGKRRINWFMLQRFTNQERTYQCQWLYMDG